MGLAALRVKKADKPEVIMRCRSLVITAILGVLVLSPAPASAQGEVRKTKGRAVLGAVIGAAAGGAAAAIFYRKSNCRYGEYANVYTECALPISGMVAGGGLAGYFIGRLAKRESRNAESAFALPSRRMIDIQTLRVPVRLRAVRPQPQKFDHVYSQLFTAQVPAPR